MNGDALYSIMSSILGNEDIDQTYALQLLNISRLNFEGLRPWTFLKAIDKTQTAAAGQNVSTALTMPTPATPSLASPYLMNYLEESTIQLVNTQNTNDVLVLREIPFERQLLDVGKSVFYSDYANRKFYILANLSNAYTVNQIFIADFGDITDTTIWVGPPSRFHPMLAYDAAARYRLGTDYDDIAARNGNDNYQTAELMLKGMVQWDARIAQAQATNRRFGAIEGGNGRYMPPQEQYDGYGGIF